MACSQRCCPSEKSETGMEKVVREDFSQEIWRGSQRQKEQSPELTNSNAYSKLDSIPHTPSILFLFDFFHFSMFYFVACI